MSVFLDFVAFWDKIQEYTCSNKILEKKIICFDYGTRKIGVAVSDDNQKIAFPKEVAIGEWRDKDDTVKAMYNLCKKYNSNFIAIGLPKKLNGEYSENCDRVIQIANLLDEKMKNAIILLFDERFSTKAVSSVFHTRIAKSTKTHQNQKKTKSKTHPDDAQSASVILNDILDTKPHLFNNPFKLAVN